jgi:hypothetical protein
MAKRPYSSSTAPTGAIRAFIGLNEENTPTKGLLTLYVVGSNPVRQVTSWLDTAPTINTVRAFRLPIQHIYFGANGSFDGTKPWIDMTRHFLNEGFWCSLEASPKHSSILARSTLIKHAKFIPVIRIRIGSLDDLGSNAVIKLDDLGLERTNKGVWTFPFRSLGADSLTPWDKYSKDIVLSVDLGGRNAKRSANKDSDRQRRP